MSTTREPSLKWKEGLLYFIAFATGAAGLVYQILWNRYLLLVAGSTTYAVSGILMTFIGGLALGSFWGGKIARRLRQPLRFYILLEFTIAVLAIAYLEVLKYMTGGALAQYSNITALFIQGWAFFGLLIPTMAMGASFPVLVWVREQMAGKSSKAPGLFYGWDTLGATLGAVGTGFFLIPGLGMQHALWTGIALTAVAVVLALILERDYPQHTPAVKAGVVSGLSRSHNARWIIAALVLAGVSSFGYEIVWTRILVLIIGSSTYAFTLTVAVFVLGTALGSLGMSRLIPRLRSPLEVFIHTQIGIGVLAIFTLYLYGQMPELYIGLVSEQAGPESMLAMQAFVAALIMLPPALLIGAAFPLGVHLLDDRYRKQEQSFGLAYGLISTGNVLGILVTTFILIPLLGLQHSTIALGLLNLSVAVLLLLLPVSLRGRSLLFTLITAFSVFAVFFTPSWNPVLMTSGVYAKLPVYKKLTGSENNFENLLKLYRLKYYKESIENVTSVVEMPSLDERPYYALAIDGKVDASTGAEDMKTQVLSGHLPFIFDRTIEKTLVIGLASGITSGALGLHPVSDITTVEIEPAMKQAASVFKQYNNNILNDKRMKMVIDDGRHYLSVNPESYDLIVSEPSNPWMSGPSRLFTREFYRLAKKRLKADGLLVQWIPFYGMGTPYFKSIIHTFLTIFPHAAAFQVSGGDMVLIGSPGALEISAGRLNRLFENEKIRNSLERAEIHTPGAIPAKWLGSAAILKTISKDARLNTDNNGYVEFGAPKFLYRNTIEQNQALFRDEAAIARNLLEHIKWDMYDHPNRNDLLLSLAKKALQENRDEVATAIEALFKQDGTGLYRRYLSAIVAEHKGDERQAAVHYEKAIALDPEFKNARWQLIQHYVSNGQIQKAQRVLDGIPSSRHTNRSHYWQGVIGLISNQPGKTVNHFSSIDVSGMPEHELQIALYGFIASDQAGDSLKTRQYKKMLKKSLATLRKKAEHDEALQRIHELLNMMERAKARWLPEPQSQKIDELLARDLLLPLQHYNHGINAMLTGRFQEARESFQKVKYILPPENPATRATYFLTLLDSIKEMQP